MKTKFGAGFLLAITVSISVPADEAMLPKILYHEAYEKPVWVSQSAIFEDPSLVHAVLPGSTIRIIEAWDDLETCIEIRTQNEPLPANSTDDANALSNHVRSAERFLLGQVAERETGLFQGHPGTLVRIRPLETYFGAMRGGDELVFIPVGQVKIEKRRICGIDKHFSSVPSPGEEVMLLVPRHWFNTGEILFLNGHRGFLPIVDGRVTIPAADDAEPNPPRGKADFVQWVRRQARHPAGTEQME